MPIVAGAQRMTMPWLLGESLIQTLLFVLSRLICHQLCTFWWFLTLRGVVLRGVAKETFLILSSTVPRGTLPLNSKPSACKSTTVVSKKQQTLIAKCKGNKQCNCPSPWTFFLPRSLQLPQRTIRQDCTRGESAYGWISTGKISDTDQIA